MPPKSKSKPKKTTKPEIKTSWDDLDDDTLQQSISQLITQHSQALEERIEIQTEHDAVRSYYNITRQQIDALEDDIKLKLYDIEQQQDDNLSECKVYSEKVRQLSYDYESKVRMADETKEGDILKHKEEYQEELVQGENMVLGAAEELRERQVVHVEEIRQQKLRLEGELRDLEKSLDADLKDLEKKRTLHEMQIEDDLDLKRQVDLRDMEEQMNLHIFELERRHEELYENTKSHYSKTSSENSDKIAKLQEECSKISEAISKYDERSKSLGDENNRLSRPLSELSSKVNLIKAQIKDKDKNRQSLLNVRSRMIVVQDKLEQQGEDNEKLQSQYNEMKDEYEKLKKELNIMSDLEMRIQSDANVNPLINESITKAIAQLQNFQTASGATQNIKDQRSPLAIKGDNVRNGTPDSEGSRQAMAMDSQRSFNKALWRLKSEMKSMSLDQRVKI